MTFVQNVQISQATAEFRVTIREEYNNRRVNLPLSGIGDGPRDGPVAIQTDDGEVED